MRIIFLLFSLFFSIAAIAQPSISSFSPVSGGVGTSVTITGTNFNTTASNNIVFVGGVKAAVTAASATSLTVTVPAGASYQPVTVTTGGLTAYSSVPFVVTFTNRDTVFRSTIFSPKANQNGFSVVYAVSIADMDGDNKPDIVATEGAGNFVSVLLNKGKIAFGNKIFFSTNNNPTGMINMDFDGDGKPDIVTLNNNFDGRQATISLYRNTGVSVNTVSFATKQDIVVSTSSAKIVAGDINGDGKPDIIVGKSDTVSVFLNNSTTGNLSLSPEIQYSTGLGFTGNKIALGDLDGDGKPELLLGGSSGIISVVRADAAGVLSFATHTDFTTTISPAIPIVCDIDGDGKNDIVTVNITSNKITVLRNTTSSSTFTFDTALSFDTNTLPGIAIASDLNGDGKPDLIVGDGTNGDSLSIFKNTSVPGSVSLKPRQSYSLTTRFTLGGIAAGDFDGDGKPDLLISNGTSASVWRNRISEPVIFSIDKITAKKGDTLTVRGNNFTSTNAIGIGGGLLSNFIFDNDSTLRVVLGDTLTGILKITNPYGSDSLLVQLTTPPKINSFTPSSGITGTTVVIKGSSFSPNPVKNIVYFGAVKATVTAATDSTLTVTVPTGASFQPISVLTNKLIGYSTKPFKVNFPGNGISFNGVSFARTKSIVSGTSPRSVRMVDLDGDGKADLITTNQGNPSVATIGLFRNVSTPSIDSFSAKISLTAGTGISKICAGDLNGDGKPDIVVSNFNSGNAGSISIFRNTSTVGIFSFGPKIDSTVGNGPLGLAIADLDGDGKPEVLVAAGNAGYISIFKNTSLNDSLSFSSKINISNTGHADNILVTDIDGDGKPDLVASNFSTGSISVYRNTGSFGNISFAAKVDFTVGSNPGDLACGDLDGDGVTDIIVSNYSSNTISVLHNTSTIGNISFDAKTDLVTGTNPMELALEDLDGDGKTDICVVNNISATLSVLKNNCTSGNISFAQKFDYITESQPNGICVGDLNGDGKPDIATANGNANFSFFRNKISEPQLISFTPYAAVSGDTVSIKGYYLTGITSVSFGGRAASSFTINNDSSLTAIAGNGLSGFVKVASPYGTDSMPSIRFNVPFIDSVSPAAAAVGETVTIKGRNFSTPATGNIVYFGSVKAVILGGTANSITATVPNGATYRPVSITNTTGFTAYGSNSFITTFPNRDTVFGATTFRNKVVQSSFSGSLLPNRFCLQDFDGDGKPDLALANLNNTLSVGRNTGGAGTNIFSARVDFPADASPISIVSADFDGDGKFDIATANGLSQNINTYLNTSTGTGSISFSARKILSTNSYRPAIWVNDIDGDGKPDIVYSNADTLFFLLNTSTKGNISFGPAKNIKTNIFFNGWLTLGDLNGDGIPELILRSIKQLAVLKNLSYPGQVLFNNPINLVSANTNYGDLIISDIDRDGKNDIVSLSPDSVKISINRNTGSNGNLAFADKIDFSVGQRAKRIMANDIDGDGKPDLMIVNENAAITLDSIYLYRNTSLNGRIAMASPYKYAPNQYITDMVSADVDGNGKPDLVISDFNNVNAAISIIPNKISEPAILSVTPLSASIGDTLTIRGNNFTGVTAVSIAKSAASSFVVVADTLLKAIVGNSGGNGTITVTNSYGADTIAGFKKIGLPQIKGFTPSSNGNGKTVTIGGKNFTGTTQVSFGNVNAKSFVVKNDTTISAVVNTGGSGFVKVVNAIGADSLTGFTFVNPPKILSFSPSSAAAGDLLTIKGLNLSTVSTVYFDSLGNSFAQNILSANDTLITGVQVPSNASGGIIYVFTKGGYDSLFGFTLIKKKPVLKSAAPLVVRPGDIISLKGSSLNSLLNVQLGDSTARITYLNVTNDSVATVTVGFVNSGNLKLIGNGGNDSIAGLIYVPPPRIFSFTPVSAPVGASVTIKGKYFSPIPDSNIVYIGAVKAVITSASDSLLTVTVPIGASLSTISVTVNKLIARSSNCFVPSFTANASINFGQYSFKKDSLTIRTGLNPQKPQLMDIDTDGKPDLVILNRGVNTFSVLRNNSVNKKLVFDGGTTTSTGLNTKYISVGDFDRDGKTDIALNQSFANTDTLSLLKNLSTIGNIQFSDRVKRSITGAILDEGTSIADWDMDGKLDLANPRISTQLLNGIIPQVSSGVNMFSPNADPFANGLANILKVSTGFASTVGDRYYTALGNDLNGDQKTDLVCINRDSSIVRIIQNLIKGPSISEFVSGVNRKIIYPVGLFPVSLLIQDLNGDEKPDIITLSSVANSLSILKNITTADSIFFDNKTDITTIQNPINMSIVDFNGDGKPDIAVANASTISLYRNTSSGSAITFADPVNFSAGQNISSIITGDINLDGKPDIIITDTVSNTSTFLINQFDEPKIISLLPNSAKWSDTVMVKGQNFAGVNKVSIGSVSVSSFTVLNDSTISFIPGNLVNSGTVKVTAFGGEDSVAGFTNKHKPILTSFSPITGITNSVITIIGRNFSDVSAVSFGNTSALSITGKSDTLITAVVGAGSSGKVSVVNSFGGDSLSGFTFIAKPVMSSFSPLNGKAGSVISISGKNLSSISSVRFGNKSAQNITVLNDSLLSATVADGASGFVSIANNYYSDSLNGFIYSVKPKINSFSPLQGTNGTLITINGYNLGTLQTVSIGNMNALSITAQSDTVVTAIVGNGSSGYVSVSNMAGADSLNGFEYISKPSISSFSPVSGIEGSVINIKGKNLSKLLSVAFGSVKAVSINITSDTLITATVGKGSSGYVTLSNMAGVDSLNGFEYVAKPVISSFSPASGVEGAGITLKGRNLKKLTSVLFGNTPVVALNLTSDTLVTVLLGKGASGNVVVSNIAGSDSLSGFTFLKPPVINSFSPLAGGFGTEVTIAGKNFLRTSSVLLGTAPAVEFRIIADTILKATVGKSGTGRVTVKNPDGDTSLAGFSFINPSITVSNPEGPLLFTYVNGGLFKTLRFQVAGKYMSDSIEIIAPGDFVISKSFNDPFLKSIKLPNNSTGIIDTTSLFVQYKGQGTIGNITDSILIKSNSSSTLSVPVNVKLCDSVILFKPVINNLVSGINCFKDSVSLEISNGKTFNYYLWSTGDTTKSITIKQSNPSVSVKVANQLGCYSENAASLQFVQNTNPVPSIAQLVDNSLLSTSAPNYRWFINNTSIAGNTSNKLVPAKIGFYSVETSNDKICWDRSNDYTIFTISTPLVNDTVAIRTFPNPSTTGSFYVVATLQRPTNVVARVTVTDVNGVVLLQTSKFIFFGREIKVPITLAVKGTVFAKIDINGDIKTQTVILQ